MVNSDILTGKKGSGKTSRNINVGLKESIDLVVATLNTTDQQKESVISTLNRASKNLLLNSYQPDYAIVDDIVHAADTLHSLWSQLEEVRRGMEIILDKKEDL